MRRIVYTSIATGADATAEVARILRVARELNGVDGVTGLLCARGDRFLQAIEGPEESVVLAFERIKRDPRHRAIETLSNGKITAREFGDWTMAYVDKGEPDDLLGERMRVLLAGVSADLAARFHSFTVGQESG